MEQKSSLYLKTKDYFLSGESFDLLLDEEKQILYTHPAPPQDQLSRYYESEAYISHQDESKGIFAFIYRLVKNYSLRKKVNLINRLNKGRTGSLLDIGAGTGDFLLKAEKTGWKAFGVEPGDKALQRALKKGLQVSSSLTTLSENQFDVITLWHALEHIPNLEETIESIHALLKPGGVLLIAVPNYKSFDANYYKSFWAAYDVPRHLWHFSQEGLKRTVGVNFIFHKTKPMLFDSFYVSLLSEKYKSKKSFSVKALWIGLLSNLKAIKTKEYSSLIYVFSKNFK